MTVIAALEHSQGVLAGCDTFLGGAYHKAVMDRPKWALHGDNFLVATAGEVRPGQVVESIVPKGKPRKDEDVLAFLRRAWVEPVRKALTNAHCLSPMSAAEAGFEALVAYGGQVLLLDGSLGLSRLAHGYIAIGAGGPAAMAAFAALRRVKLSPDKRMMRVLEAAAEHCSLVQGPFYMANVV